MPNKPGKPKRNGKQRARGADSGIPYSRIASQLQRAKVPETREEPTRLPILPKAPSGSQAIHWLEDILSRRKPLSDSEPVYHIPLSSLKFKGFTATGPSIVEDDAPVRFDFYQRRRNRLVPIYGVKGRKRGKDMPLVSNDLYASMMEALKFLPGYRETCVITGEPLEQRLFLIAHKLLKGEIRDVEDIHFKRVSDEARNAQLQSELTAARSSNLGREVWTLCSKDERVVQAAKDLVDLQATIGVDPSSSRWTDRIPIKRLIDRALRFNQEASDLETPFASLLSEAQPTGEDQV